MTKPVLVAGLLGGLLGGVGGFLLLRTFPAKPPVAAEVRSTARPLADELVAHLHGGRNDEFLKAVRPGFTELNDEQFVEFGKQMKDFRAKFTEVYGTPREFELVRETALGPNVVRFAYLERFPRGGVVWVFVFYNGGDGWQVLGFQYLKLEAAFDTLR